MADRRFYTNRGPISLAEICARIGALVPSEADGVRVVHDIASVAEAGPQHLTFLGSRGINGGRNGGSLENCRAGFCIVSADHSRQDTLSDLILLPVRSVSHAFAEVVAIFYPESAANPQQADQIHPEAKLGSSVTISAHVALGENAEIGDDTQIGANTVIGEGVTIGRRCKIGSNVTITHSYIGDDVLILPGACIGQPGFGFASGSTGHIKIPQIGRVIVQDKVEIGANTTIDRGALGDTVIGEGTKIDNLVQIGHNTHIGRHCIIVSQVGISGSCEIGDFVVMGGQVGLADHVYVESGARFAARAGVVPGHYQTGDWAGAPAVRAGEWRRQAAAVSRLGRRRKREDQ